MTENLTPEELQEAESIQTEIDQIASDIEKGERTVSSSWVRLGSRVHKVRSKKYWRAYGQHSFGAYVLSLEPKVKRKRSQIYVAVGVIETLGAQMQEDELEEMGISRANELRKYAQKSGKLVPESLLEAALDRDKDLDQLRAEIAQELHQSPPERGRWLDLGGFFATDDERKLWETTVELAKRIDPPVSHDIPEHEQLKQVIFRLAAEFQATYAGAV